MQTVMCDLSAKSNYRYSSDMPIFPNANVTHLYSALDGDLIENFGRDYCNALRSFGSQLSAPCANLIKGDSNVRFGSLLADESSFNTFLTDSLHLSQPVATTILDSTIHTQNVASILLLMRAINPSGDNLVSVNILRIIMTN
jgi:hypothetical protein